MTMLIAIIAGLEAMVVFAARSKQGRARRQQLLMGTSTDHRAAVPLVDNYLQQKAAGATRLQRFVAGRHCGMQTTLPNSAGSSAGSQAKSGASAGFVNINPLL